jgi:L-ascorbate metabolism protein UlaG (beta-lactamase superfamily)
MYKIALWIFVLLLIPSTSPSRDYDSDLIETSKGDLEITFIGHASLIFHYSGVTIHVDPWSRQADYESLPKADIILITHDHRDHLDGAAVRAVRTEETVTILTKLCADKGFTGLVMENGDTTTVRGIEIIAVPAYNVEHKRDDGSPFHSKGDGNGYLLRFGDMKVYVAGDTELIPEMSALANIDIAFLPMNLPYTMSPEMAAAAARIIGPRILYPYHYGDTDTERLVRLLEDRPSIEVRVRKM